MTEALWKGRHVVAGKAGGIPIQIQDGKNGFLVNPDNYKATAERVVELIKDKSLAREMGKKARESVRKKFLVTRLLGDYLDLITEMLKRK